MKKILASFALVSGMLSTGQLGAQSAHHCATMENLERLKTIDPGLANRMNKIEQQTQRFISDMATQKGGASTTQGTIYQIPVVVHVVYNTTAQNLSNTQIQSQIDVLNEDFRRLNADKSNTPAAFASLAADCEIQFCLASIAPNGATTTGIIRKSTTVTSWSDDDAVKHASSGGDDAWPADKYLNLWVCNLGGGLLGYAQFPGGPAATDGVVINYQHFGRGGTAGAPYDKGRTATHEVGHWLNLYHIWGDDNGACTGSDQCSDTPNQASEHYGCPTFPTSTCSNGSNGDMFMNYMDYVDDGCMNMFTLGQKSRMQALFASGGARVGLLTSNGCGGTTTGTTTPTYCSASGNSTSYEYINNVTLNTINNTSAGAAGYSNYTSLSTSLASGSAYTISLKPGFTGSTYTEYFKVFIDYNNDKDFADAGENVYTSAGTSATVSGSFTIPSTATAGTTRMRVVMSDASAINSCGTFNYGEVEDYSINITSGSTPVTSVLLTVGTGTNTTGVTPYGTYYMDERTQFILTQSELAAAGWTSANSYLRSLAFYATSSSGQVMNSFTIKVANTTASSFATTSFLSGTFTTVYSGNATVVANSWNTYNFTTAFNYNGSGNLLVEICWNNSSYTTNSSVRYTATSNYQALSYRADVASGGVCSNATGTLTYNRPNMQLRFKNSATGKFEEQEEAVAIIETGIKHELNVFPNPATDKLTVEFHLAEAQPVHIRIVDMLGRTMMETQHEGISGNNTADLNVSALGAGNYIIFIDEHIDGPKKRILINK